jgi:hypothetical protein
LAKFAKNSLSLYYLPIVTSTIDNRKKEREREKTFEIKSKTKFDSQSRFPG